MNLQIRSPVINAEEAPLANSCEYTHISLLAAPLQDKRALMPATALHDLPLIAARPPRLSTLIEAIAEIEASGIYTNGGPVVRRFESAIVEQL